MLSKQDAEMRVPVMHLVGQLIGETLVLRDVGGVLTKRWPILPR
tara:strand:+ start:381 stop:512 length:132 start_codon:yes stop_codon:yes gene_type:complete